MAEFVVVETEQDRASVIALHKICFDVSEQEKLQRALNDKECFAVLAREDDGSPLGYIVAHVANGKAYGLWNGVTPDRRGEGLTQPIGRAAMKEARSRGAVVWDAHVAEDNETSSATFHSSKKLGFFVMGSHPDFYTENGKVIEFTNYHLRKFLEDE